MTARTGDLVELVGSSDLWRVVSHDLGQTKFFIRNGDETRHVGFDRITVVEGAREKVAVEDDFPCCTTGAHDERAQKVVLPPIRARLLREAERLVTGDRAESYGDATESFTRLAGLWSLVLGTEVTPEQVALCLIQLKVSRLVASPHHGDSWMDGAGYFALGGEIAAGGA